MIVTKIEQQKRDENKYNIFIDGQFVFSLIMQDILFFKLKEGSEVSEETYTYIKDTVIYVKAQDRALKYLGYKKRTEKEIVRKLKEYEYDDEITDRVIKFLEKYKYLNDLEYAESYIRQAQRLNPKGKTDIRYKLKKLGISDDNIEKAFMNEEFEELDETMKVLEKKLNGKSSINLRENKKIQEFLLRRGFSYGIIKEAFCELKIEIEKEETLDW